ncbi:hypothetical protein [Paenibacillus sp. Mc5Re-14]|uniref:hypothetical protein n=1 Tax=Paenibacillus sp. Mc5Re-14 TaxID=1030529 RepID=UPI000ABC1BA9|nr:hypothetical protein [Paenibacillus sp. Mc5Re-14]
MDNTFEIIKMWATADKDCGFIEVSRDEETAKEWMNADEEATQVIQGWGIIDKLTNLMPDDARDFHYKLEDAQSELNEFMETGRWTFDVSK